MNSPSQRILIIILFAAAMLFPFGKVNATSGYVGLSIESVTFPGNDKSGAPWCLSRGTGTNGTRVTVENNSNPPVALPPIAPDNNPFYLTPDSPLVCAPSTVSCSPNHTVTNCPAGTSFPGECPADGTATCVGTVWSGLLDLSGGTSYNFDLSIPNFCAGTTYDGYCLETAPTTKQDCCSVCGYYGQVPAGDYYNYGEDGSCSSPEDYCIFPEGPNYPDGDVRNCQDTIAAVKGSACGTCTATDEDYPAVYSYYKPSLADPTVDDCWYYAYGWGNCTDPGSGTNVCACSTSSGGDFDFPFTYGAVNPGDLSAWSFRKAITISHANVSANLTGFPLLVTINETGGLSTNIGYHVSDQINGSDIRFTDSTGTIILPYERESFSVSSNNLTATYWVKVPTISSTADTKIYIYYGNSGATDGQDAAGVWDSNYIGVWHLNSNNGTLVTADSTGNNDLINNGATTAAGPNGTGAASFDGTSYMATANAISTPTNWTMETWINTNMSGPDQKPVGLGSTNQGPVFYLTGGKWYIYSGQWENFGGVSISSNSWQNIVFTEIPGSFYASYLDGVLAPQGSGNWIPWYDFGRLSMGKDLGTYNPDPYTGLLGETRISSIVRPAEWVKFEYYNISSSTNELSFGSQELLQ